jgi:hypothetical protein
VFYLLTEISGGSLTVPFLPDKDQLGQLFNIMKMQYFKRTRWFEAYFEIEERRILDRFYDRLSEGNDHQFWIGRCYLAFHVYRKAQASDTDAAAG